MNTISKKIIHYSFYLSVRLIEYFFATEHLQQKEKELEKLPTGTLGKAIAECLKKNNLNLVPHFESHDLKHVLLGYKMTPLDEIRMQAFMLGNGNWSLPSVAIFVYGALLLPQYWRLFVRDYRKGKRALPIKNWTIEEFAARSLDELRTKVFQSQTVKNQQIMPNFDLRTISQYGSFITIAAGIFGMLFCFPFLWSANVADLIGAGFPFVAGAILTIGGLINLSILANANGTRTS